jgi:hypothetical protein
MARSIIQVFRVGIVYPAAGMTIAYAIATADVSFIAQVIIGLVVVEVMAAA